MVTCQSSELDWEVTVELPADFLSLGKGSVTPNFLGCPGAYERHYAIFMQHMLIYLNCIY